MLSNSMFRLFGNKVFVLSALIFSMVIFSTSTIFAMPGGFDRSFASRGKARTSFGTASDKIFAMALQTDGKIVAAGASNNDTINSALVRYNTDGTLDESFGDNGKTLLDIEGSSEIAYDVKIQNNGKIIIAGTKTSADGDSDFFLARFNSNGILDEEFGTNGIVFTNIGTNADSLRAIALQNVNGEEKIVAVGSIGVGANADFAIARYNPNGTLDESFALGSGVTFISWGHEDRAEAVAIQHINGEDKIVVGGKRRLDSGLNGYNDDFALTRLNANGTIDLTFGNNGKVNTNFAAVDIIRDIVIQKIGNLQKIVVGGLGNNNFALARYHEDGSLDATYGSQGKVQTSFSTREDQIHDLFLLPDGRILAGGFTRDETGREDFALARYMQNGQTDSLFGNCGTLTSRLANTYSVIHGVAVQPDGNTIAAGYAPNGVNSDDFTVVRYIDNSAAAPTGLDFDGDGRTDTAVYRPSDGVWHINNSCIGYNSIKFGLQGDKPVPADYDGDGKTDIAVYRDGVWYLQQSTKGFYAVQFGLSTDIPTAGDFDDDGKADIAVFRPSNGVWYIFQSSDNQVISVKWGIGGDLPVAADYDGDFKTDLAVFRPSEGIWYIYRSSNQTMLAIRFGLNGDRPLVTDLDGDSLADFTIFRLNDRTWHTLTNSGGGYSVIQFGLSTDIPITGDYDGDGKTDHTVYRNGTWYYQQSKLGFKVAQFGLADDIPLTSR